MRVGSRRLSWIIGGLLGLGLGQGSGGRLADEGLVARGNKGAVVSAEKHASQVGLEVLRSGGNAIDAAVATFLTLAVTFPAAGNLGGGGFMVIRLADGRSAAIDFRETAPGRGHRDMYLKNDGSVDPEKSRLGATAVGVPGSPAGVALALEKFGTRPLKELAAPAIRLAREGFEVSASLAGSLRGSARLFARYPSTKKVFFKEGRPLGEGDLLVQEDLAGTLERFVARGPRGFYRGKTAKDLVAQMARDGGYIELDDLKHYRPKIRDVLRGTYRGHEILSMPPPSSGGIALVQMLNIIESHDLAAMGSGSRDCIHLMSEAMRRAYADRARWLGDSDFFPVPVEGLLSKGYAKKIGANLRMDKVSEVAPGRPAGAKEGDDTTHFSVLDAMGNAVSCTTTLNSSFGSGLVAEGTGVLLNNEMDDFSAKPGVPNQFGLVGGEANAIEPGKRMLSSMTPTIIIKDGKVRCVLGSPGGGRIINTVFQVTLNLLDHAMPLPEAVGAPRVHHQWKPDYLFYERGSLSGEVRAGLLEMGHHFARGPRGIGRCQAIAVEADGSIIGASDPRSGGTAMAY